MGSLKEDLEMIRYIVERVLGLTPEEYFVLYSTEFNKQYHLIKYITQIIQCWEEEFYFGKRAKDRIFSLLYPEKYHYDNEKEIIYFLNNNDESAIKYLSKLKDREKAYGILKFYLNYLLKKVFGLKDTPEIYEFLRKIEKYDVYNNIKCLSVIKKNYFCLLDFYFFHLPKKVQQEDFLLYIRERAHIKEGVEIIELGLKLICKNARINIQDFLSEK